MSLIKTKTPGVMYRVGANRKRQYSVSFSDENGKRRRQRVHGDLATAERVLAEIKAKVRGGGIVSPQDVTLNELYGQWKEIHYPKIRQGTVDNYERIMHDRILPELGTTKIQGLDVEQIANLVRKLEETYAPGTVEVSLASLGLILKFAIRRKIITTNPVSLLERNERPRVQKAEIRILRPQELDRLFEGAKPRWRLPIKTVAFCGLRAGELLGLQWQDVEFENGTVQVRRQVIKATGELSDLAKTPAGHRTIYVMPALSRALREHKLASPYSQEGQPVFCRTDGRHNVYNSFQTGMVAAAKRAGLMVEGKPTPTLHSLRHGFGSMLIANGADIAFVSKQMGHENLSFTLDTYTHEWEHGEAAKKATNVMEQTFAALV